MSLRIGPIAIIGAMAEEISLLLDHMENVTTSTAAGIDYHEGQLRGKRVVAVKSGVGKVNAAICTQILIDRYAARKVIFTGVAGALDPSLAIGDIVVSSECMYHDMDVTALGFPLGTIPFESRSVFPSDAELAKLAMDSGAGWFDGRIVQGRILSGDQFVADRGVVRKLREELNGACTEMEGAAVAHVCAMNEVEHVIIRSMSDRADGSAPDNFRQFTERAAANSYRIVEGILDRLSS
jgi:adenosylhomocysteine nucleosidase